MSNWGDKELRALLALANEEAINRQMTGTVRDGPMYERIAEGLTSRGFPWSKAQVISKLKNVKKKFHEINDHNSRSGRGRLDWPYLDLCQNIWGSSHSANPVSIQGSLDATPAIPSPASTDRSDKEADSQNGENGTESQTDQVPPPAKRRKVTKAKLVAQEITELMEAMDRKDAERERLCFEGQIAREAALLREAQEAERAVREENRQERAEQFRMLACMFQEQANLMRDLINRLPVPVPQHSTPHHYRAPASMRYGRSPPPPFPSFHTEDQPGHSSSSSYLQQLKS